MEHGMSKDGLRARTNPLSALVLTIGSAFGVAVPMTVFVVWICS
jgi:hypothetical protein